MDPDQMALSDASLSGSTMFSKKNTSQFSRIWDSKLMDYLLKKANKWLLIVESNLAEHPYSRILLRFSHVFCLFGEKIYNNITIA